MKIGNTNYYIKNIIVLKLTEMWYFIYNHTIRHYYVWKLKKIGVDLK